MLRDIQPNDEGLMLQAAARIAHGEVPYRDFWWFYPPGQPYLLGALHALFGPSLLPWRIVRVLADATVALLAWRLAGRAASPRLALVAWAAAILAMAYPSGPHPFPIALALALGALLTFERRPVLAGVLTGACAAWRIEFAVFAAAGIVLAQRPPWRYLAAAAGTAALLFAPVVIAAGLGRSWDLLVDYPLTDFRDYQALPFPTGLRRAAEHGLDLRLRDGHPRAAAAVLPAARARDRRGRSGVRAGAPPRRADHRDGHLHGRHRRLPARPHRPVPHGAARRHVRGAGGVGAGEVVGGRAGGGASRSPSWSSRGRIAAGWACARTPCRWPTACARRAAEAAELEATVRAVQRAVPPGEPIYVAPRRADQVTAGYPLLYVLADRPNPTRYDIAAPGVVTSAPVQREIVRDLERTRPRVVVRWESPLSAAPEPNAAGRSSGVRLLDDYLARAYAPGPRYGTLRMLLRRP